MFRYINQSSYQLTKQSTKKTQIDKVSIKSLGSETKSNNKIKAIKYIAQKILPDYE